ncbi:hypothetical protein, partial [Hydrogenimonas sp.]
MPNPTPLQKIKAQITLLDAGSNPHRADGAYPVYTLEGEEALGMPGRYEVSFVSPVSLEVEKLA